VGSWGVSDIFGVVSTLGQGTILTYRLWGLL
jgi:hypothetical protein